MGAVAGPVIDVQAERESPADEGVFEHRQEGGGVFRQGAGGEGDDAGGIVDECDEVGFAAFAPVADLGAVHHIAHPQLAGFAVGEAAPVGADRLTGRFVEQALAGEQAVHGRGGQGVVEAVFAGGLADLAHREGGVIGLDGEEALGDLGGQAPGGAAVGACPGVERGEAGAAVLREPVAQGLGGDAGASGAGDGVGLFGPDAQLRADPRCPGREVDEVGDEAVAEQCDGLSQIVAGVLGGVGAGHRYRPGSSGHCPPGRGRYAPSAGRVMTPVVLEPRFAIPHAAAVATEPQRRGQLRQLRCTQGAQRLKRAVGPETFAHRAERRRAVGERFGEQTDDGGQEVMDLAHPTPDPTHGARQLDGLGAQQSCRRTQARCVLGGGHDRLEGHERARQPRGQTVGQQRERGVAVRAVPASDARPARGLARVGA